MAQSVEQLIRNQQVVGSSPISSSKQAPLGEEPVLFSAAERRGGWWYFSQRISALQEINAEGGVTGQASWGLLL